MAKTNEDAGDLALTHGTVQPDSSLEDASIASGIPAASLDIYYDSDDAEKHRHEHSRDGIPG